MQKTFLLLLSLLVSTLVRCTADIMPGTGGTNTTTSTTSQEPTTTASMTTSSTTATDNCSTIYQFQCTADSFMACPADAGICNPTSDTMPNNYFQGPYCIQACCGDAMQTAECHVPAGVLVHCGGCPSGMCATSPKGKDTCCGSQPDGGADPCQTYTP